MVTGGVVGMRTDSLQRRNAETPASDAVGASPAVNLLRTLDKVAIVKLVGINSVIGRTAAVLLNMKVKGHLPSLSDQVVSE